MTNVKLEITCEVNGKRYRFVEDTWEDNNCESLCALRNKICPRIIMGSLNFTVCEGVNYGHWEEIK